MLAHPLKESDRGVGEPGNISSSSPCAGRRAGHRVGRPAGCGAGECAAYGSCWIEARAKPLLTVDGLTFKDLNGNGQLDPYEDWRRPIC